MNSSLTTVWLLLVAVTFGSSAIANVLFFDGRASAVQSTLAVLLIAFAKTRFVLLDFMEVRSAPMPLRIISEAWVALGFLALAGLYLLAGSMPPPS